MNKKYVPDFLKILLKRTAFRLYSLSERFFTGPFDKYDFQAIRIFRKYLRPDSNCIDIGANYGHILREIIKAAPRGHHLAFEPIPQLYEKLKKKYGKRVQVYNLALSDHRDTVEFAWYPERPGISGFRERSHMGGNFKAVTIKVETRKLDELIPEGTRIDLIKIDVEGAEWQVLLGAVQTLKTHHPMVLFESGLGGADAYETKPESIFDLLHDCGLSLSLMEYFLAGKPPFTRDEFCGQFYKGYNFFFIAYPLSLIKNQP